MRFLPFCIIGFVLGDQCVPNASVLKAALDEKCEIYNLFELDQVIFSQNFDKLGKILQCGTNCNDVMTKCLAKCPHFDSQCRITCVANGKCALILIN